MTRFSALAGSLAGCRGVSPGRVLVLAGLLGSTAWAGDAAWPQFGGPQRNFAPQPCAKLADAWPKDGPKVAWKREIGPGHSSIVVDGGVLYTMYRGDEQDVVVALKADTGEPVWEFAYDCPMKPGMQLEFGPGPHSTPLIAGDRLYTLSATVLFHCLDRKTGKALWKHDLMAKLGAGHNGRGYGASPLAYKDLVILNVGSQQCGVAAFKQDSGELAWKSEPLRGGYSSPILAAIEGVDHLVVSLGRDRLGLDPATGETLWKLTVDESSAGMMATPIFVPPDRLFYSSGYGGGTRVLRVARREGKWSVEELWHSLKMKVHHASMVLAGDHVYASSGDFGPAMIMGIDVDDGRIAWRERGFSKANVLLADGKLIVLDEEGQLALARATPEGFKVLSQAAVLEHRAWTCPTLVGTRLYLRDYRTIMALELGPGAEG